MRQQGNQEFLSNLSLKLQYSTMQKKNSQKRFHTAAARIMLSHKLPNDFFTMSREKIRLSTNQNSGQGVENIEHITVPPKDSLLFTFRHPSSHNVVSLPACSKQKQCPKLKGSDSCPKLIQKLPSLNMKQNNTKLVLKQGKLLRLNHRAFRQRDWINQQRALRC